MDTTRRYSDRDDSFRRDDHDRDNGGRFSGENFYWEREKKSSADDREFSRHPSFENELERESDERYRGRPIRLGESYSSSREGMWEAVMNFFGVGPKGYRRSDQSLFEDVCETLARHSAIDASDIEVSVTDGLVTLTGSVPSRRMKRMAEDCLDDVSGVTDVQNHLRVGDRSALATSSAATPQSTPGPKIL